MLFLHEVHEVRGACEVEFEAAFRDGWMPTLAKSDEARLLYYLNHAVGTGVSYNVVTLSAIRDGASWESLVRRTDQGDLCNWAQAVDRLRYDVRARMLIPLPWSPLQTLNLDDVPTTPTEHALSIYLEDTVWPYPDRLEEYVEASGSHYATEFAESAKDRPSLLRIEASFRTAFGSHRRREVVLWQKVVDPQGLLPLITQEIPARFKQAGTWMADALKLRDRWESKLLRTSSWSPWY